MSKLLQKILSAAIFPAALIIVSKIIGMVLVNGLFGLEWAIQTNTGSVFSVQVVYPDRAAAIMCNSYSNLFVLIVMSIGVGILLFQNAYLNVSYQNPKVLVKLVQFDFLLWLSESSTILPKLVVWVAFHWTVSTIAIAQAFQNNLYTWIAVLSFILSILATWIAFQGIEREIRHIAPENGKLNTQ